MSEAWTFYECNNSQRILIIADHASNHVPPDIDLGIDPALLSDHIAVDIGVAALCEALPYPAILGGVSRLVVDLNREEDAPHTIPTSSDGHAISGNLIDHAARQARIERFWHPYHKRVAGVIEERAPTLLVSLHSFTPRLKTVPDIARPWEIGILYNQDDRAARIAIPMLEAQGIVVGDQEPYSGVLLNASMNRHGESNEIAYLGIEMRQDLISDSVGVKTWADRLAPVIAECAAKIAEMGNK
jgi:predicted N-formylglutamate amidohydrolase